MAQVPTQETLSTTCSGATHHITITRDGSGEITTISLDDHDGDDDQMADILVALGQPHVPCLVLAKLARQMNSLRSAKSNLAQESQR